MHGLCRTLEKFFVCSCLEFFAVHPRLEIPQTFDGRLRRLQAVKRKIQLLAVRHRCQQIAHSFRRMTTGQHVAQCIEIAERFGHLLPINQQELGMQPMTHERFSGERDRLGDLIFVVRKNQIHSARMNVDDFAQIANGHHGALDVPAGTPRSNRSFPEGLAVLRRLPQHKVARIIFLVVIDIHSRAGTHTRKIVVRKFSVVWETGDPKINGAVTAIGETLVGQCLDGLCHLLDVFGRADQSLRTFQAQQLGIVEKSFLVDGGVFVQFFFLRQSIANDLVFHVGDVHDMVKNVSACPEPAAHQVVKREGPEIADMRIVVHGRTACVYAGGIVPEGRKLLHLLRERIIEPQCHTPGFNYRSIQAFRRTLRSG